MDAEQLEALLAVAATSERLDVPFFVAGSYASNACGFYRATADADLVADLKIRHVKPLVEATGIALAAVSPTGSGAMCSA